MTSPPDSVHENPAANDHFPALRGHTIRKDDNGLVCLNDIWQAAGSFKNQRPNDWSRSPVTKRLVTAVIARNAEILRIPVHGIDDRAVLDSRKGYNGGTYADARLAVAYAEWLNPDLAVEVKEVFIRFKIADADLADDILDRSTDAENERVAMRALGRAKRRKYTDCLKDHGAEKGDYGACTDTLYLTLFGQRTRALKIERGLAKSRSLRDSMATDELAYVMAAETLATERINEEGCDGGEACRTATQRSAGFMRQAIEADRRDRKPHAANDRHPSAA